MNWWENVSLWLKSIGSKSKVVQEQHFGHIDDMASREFLAFAKVAQQYELEYLILGAASLVFHGLARNTHDIDIWINPTERNMIAFENTLRHLGYEDLEGLDDYPLGEPRFWHIAGPIDIMTVCHGAYDFITCCKRRMDIEYKGAILPTMHMIDVRDLKVRAKRDQDLRDVIIIDNYLREHNLPREFN